MTRPRKFVLPAVVAALWVATFGFVPRVTSASPSSNEVGHAARVRLDATGARQGAYMVPHSNHVESDGVYVGEDGPDVAYCEVSDTFAVVAPSPSIREHRDRAYLRSNWESLAARGPPQS